MQASADTHTNPADVLVIAGRVFRSRLMVGTGKFPSTASLKATLDGCDAEIVTVALRRADLSNPNADSILSAIDPQRHLLLPNTSGARSAEEAVRLARLARAAGCEPWVKLELTPEPRYLLPDPIETLRAAEMLVKEGFVVLPYIQADPILAKRLEEAGTATVMPLGAPIGSNKGLKTREMIRIIIEQANVPVVVDAGLGAPSHAAEAMEMGADAVLVNTALADASDHYAMGRAFALATEAGRLAYLSGLGPVREVAEASSPLTGFLDTL
ncbi:MAG: thiazole synthase [Candidatus Hydrogenedentota bacterium]